jgi:short-subunit dehydrogenase
VICPGFVKSRITDANGFAMPFLMEADAAARVISRGLARNAARISFPWPVAAAVWLLALLPPGWTDGLLARAPKKG